MAYEFIELYVGSIWCNNSSKLLLSSRQQEVLGDIWKEARGKAKVLQMLPLSSIEGRSAGSRFLLSKSRTLCAARYHYSSIYTISSTPLTWLQYNSNPNSPKNIQRNLEG